MFSALSFGQAESQDDYSNLDPNSVLKLGETDDHHSIRFFGGHENLTYATLSHRYGMAGNMEGMWRAVIAGTKSTPAAVGGNIFFGGVDFEAALRYRLTSTVVGQIGIATPFTPAQKSPILTLGLSTSKTLNDKLSLTVNPRAVLVRDNALVGFGMGFDLSLQSGLDFTAEYTPMLSGDNTRDVFDGKLMRRNLYTFAFNYQHAGSPSMVTFGITNATGGTTGFSLTPGLGGSSSVFISIRGRF